MDALRNAGFRDGAAVCAVALVFVVACGQHAESGTNGDGSRRSLTGQEMLTLLPQIKLGSTRGEVKRILGDPTTDLLITTKETNQPMERRVIYYASECKSAEPVEACKEFLKLSFDLADRLVRVEPHIGFSPP
jgi:hypothetical protein